MIDAIKNQFETFPDLFPSFSQNRYKNPFNADFIACSSCKNITLRLMYGTIRVISYEDAKALLSRGFTCIHEGRAVGNMVRKHSELCFLGKADLARLNRQMEDARNSAADTDEMAHSDEVAAASNGPLAEFIRNLQTEEAIQNAEQIIKTFFSHHWSSLDTRTQSLLAQAEMLRQELVRHEHSGAETDFAPAVMQFSRALEHELGAKIFDPFRDISNEGFVFGAISSNRTLETFEKLRLFCQGERENTLGDMAFILLKVGCSKSTKNSFQDFLNGIGLSRNLLCGKSGIASRIHEYTARYRNTAAHVGHISIEECTGARAYLIEEPKKLLIALAACNAAIGDPDTSVRPAGH